MEDRRGSPGSPQAGGRLREGGGAEPRVWPYPDLTEQLGDLGCVRGSRRAVASEVGLLLLCTGSGLCRWGRGCVPEGSLMLTGLRIINAEKSEFNEDQAACGQLCIRRCEFGAEEDQEWLTLCPEEVSTAGPRPGDQDLDQDCRLRFLL